MELDFFFFAFNEQLLVEYPNEFQNLSLMRVREGILNKALNLALTRCKRKRRRRDPEGGGGLRIWPAASGPMNAGNCSSRQPRYSRAGPGESLTGSLKPPGRLRQNALPRQRRETRRRCCEWASGDAGAVRNR